MSRCIELAVCAALCIVLGASGDTLRQFSAPPLDAIAAYAASIACGVRFIWLSRSLLTR